MYVAHHSAAASNFELPQLKQLVATGNPPAVNQVSWHVGYHDDFLRDFAKENKIVLQAYSPLGDGSSELITGPLVSGIGERYSKSGAQVSLRWVAQHGVPLSTKSTEAKYLSQDIDIFDWALGDDDMTKLDTSTSPAGRPSFVCNEEAVVESKA